MGHDLPLALRPEFVREIVGRDGKATG